MWGQNQILYRNAEGNAKGCCLAQCPESATVIQCGMLYEEPEIIGGYSYSFAALNVVPGTQDTVFGEV